MTLFSIQCFFMSKKWTLKLNAMSMFLKFSTLNSIQCSMFSMLISMFQFLKICQNFQVSILSVNKKNLKFVLIFSVTIFILNNHWKKLKFLQKMIFRLAFWAKTSNFSFKILKILKTLRHWKHWTVFQYIESKTLNSLQCRCEQLKHWKATQCQY